MGLEKTEWGALRIIFLGILLDGESFTLTVPIEKRNKAINLLKEMIDRKKATVKQLQSLCGFLNFLGKAIFLGRTFTRRMYAKYSSFVSLDSTHKHKQSKLKPHHHICLDAEFKKDCATWLDFLEGSLQSVVNRPMVDLMGRLKTSQDIFFYSDASAAESLGFGCILNRNWIWGKWEPNFIRTHKPSIEFLELFGLCAGIITWQDHADLVNCRVSIFCDNMAVVGMVNDMSSTCKYCMHLLRILALNGLRFNQRITAKFVGTKDNGLADALSRGQITRFRRLGPQMNEFPHRIPECMWPLSKLWNQVA